jgi:DMSO/TMAO reductase YedYZ molybdopterin-dependent catalytic subunit
MKTGKILIVSIGLLIVAFLAVLFLVNPTGIKWVSPLLPSASAQTTKNSQEVEINNYQGERLDPISNFQENSIKGPQKVDIATYRLRVKGPDGKQTAYRYEDVLKWTPVTKVITLNCVEGWSVKILWEGVRVADLLAPLSSTPTTAQPALFGGRKPETLIVKFFAVDGYSTSLPLKYVLDRNLLLAYKMNGVTLPPERGFPFQLVAEDKWGYKWIKWVQTIELSADITFKGYWESRGYNQDGDQKGPIFD